MNISYESAIDSVIDQAVEIGEQLPESAREFFVAYCYQLQALGAHVWPMIALRLRVHEIGPAARMFAEWGDATVAGDMQRCQELEDLIDTAGFRDECGMALDASSMLSRTLPAVLRAMPPSGALH